MAGNFATVGGVPRPKLAPAYSGRIGKRTLTPGRYRATLVAREAAGNRSAATRVRFTVVRR